MKIWMHSQFFTDPDSGFLTPYAYDYGQVFYAPQTPASTSTTIAEVQHNSVVNSNSLAFTGNNTAGNCIVVAIVDELIIGGTTPTVSDSNGNTYTLATDNTVSGGSHTCRLTLYYALNIAAGANTVTVTVNGNATPLQGLIIYEYSGVDTVAALDVTSSARASSPATSDTASFTTAVDGEVVAIIAGAIDNSGNSESLVGDAAYTKITGAGSIGGSNTFVMNWLYQWAVQTSAGAGTATVSSGGVSTNFLQVYVILKPSVALGLALIDCDLTQLAAARTDNRIFVCGTAWDAPPSQLLGTYSASLDPGVTYTFMGQVLSRLSQTVPGFTFVP
jgi:uncharacterized Zn-binding protein involved in type VI secretion